MGSFGISNEGKKWEDDTYTLRPGESSVYNFNMVFDDPPAPAARDELGLEVCDVARRLQRKKDMTCQKDLNEEERLRRNDGLFRKGRDMDVPDLRTGRFCDCCC